MKYLLLMMPLLLCAAGDAAEYATPNFTVNAETAALAQTVGDAAEYHRAQHAREWIGAELPKWAAPCPIQVKTGALGAGGITSFNFKNGHVYDWGMIIQGTPEKVVTTVLPHEVLHTIFASHYRRSIPRWADEGAATYVEDAAEKKRIRLTAAQVVGTTEQIPIRQLLKMTEYPTEGRAVAVMYAQGFYLVEYLVDQKGKREFIAFLETYFKNGRDWDTAFKTHYGFKDQEAAYTAAYNAHRVLTDSLEIRLVTGPDCPHCINAKIKTVPILKRKGIKVKIISRTDSPVAVNGIPVFLLYRNGKRVGRLDGYRTAAEVIAEYQKTKPQAVQVAQGVGIGYFGQVGGGAQNRPNPHRDLNPGQLQTINAAIDDRAQVKINQAISANMDNLQAVIDARISAAVLKIRADLTPEQKTLLNATAAQKAALDGLQAKIDQVAAGENEFKKQTAAQVAAQGEQTAALAKTVEETKEETKTIKGTIAARVLEVMQDKLPDTGPAAAIPGAINSLFTGGPVGLGLYLAGRLLARRREDETAPGASK